MAGTTLSFHPPQNAQGIHQRSSSLSCGAVEPAMETICAVMVTHHPDANLIGRIEKILPQVQQLVIVDNGSSEPSVQHLKDIANSSNAHLILNPCNEGIARALNFGANWAATKGYQWILLLDQDTTVESDIVESLSQVYREDAAPSSIAVIGSNFIDKVTGKPSADPSQLSSRAGTDVVAVVTSGSLVSLNILRSIGAFRDDFFIDCVDFEYCLRARAHGYRVIETVKPLMTHGIGQLTEHRFLGKRVGASNHAALRRYFIARNGLILAREYLTKEPRWVLAYLWALLKLVMVICLFEKSRLIKLKSVLRGCFDGMLGRTGNSV